MNYTNLQIYIFIGIIIIISIYFIYYIDEYHADQSVEHYDARMSNITETQCGTECTQAQNCVAFGYKPIGGKCYLSETSILGSPIGHIYSDEYTKLDRRCNKINRINDEDRIDGISLTENSIYICSDGENNISTEFQYANYGASSLDNVNSTIFNRSDTDRITPQTVQYPIGDIIYPKEKKDILPEFIKKQEKDSTDKGGKFGFIESDKEYLGQYTLAHQCVVNVPMYDCLKYCENSDNCAGTEWNKTLVKTKGKENHLYENVCCPKAIIKKVIPRRNKFIKGRFYVKKELPELLNRDKIIMTKSKLHNSIPTNDRFNLSMTDYKIPNVNDPDQQDLSNVSAMQDPILNK
jgi:hypothetical protein